jgi:hypothetical protein
VHTMEKSRSGCRRDGRRRGVTAGRHAAGALGFPSAACVRGLVLCACVCLGTGCVRVFWPVWEPVRVCTREFFFDFPFFCEELTMI